MVVKACMKGTEEVKPGKGNFSGWGDLPQI